MRHSQLFLAVALIGLVGASCVKRKEFPSLAGGSTAASGTASTAQGGAGGTTASSSGFGGLGTGGAGGIGGMGGQFNVIAASTGAGMGGGACDQFCGVCACPSTECTMCCVKAGKSDACHQGVCSCF